MVGSGCSQALEQYVFYADYIPEQYKTESLANGLCTIVKSGEKVLIPRAKEGSLVLEQILSANRIDAQILSIYDVRGARTENWKYLNNYDAILFASASGVHAFADCLAETGQPDWNPAQGKKRIVLGTIGQVTADALIKCGLPADVIPEKCDSEGLVRALDSAFDVKNTDNKV